MFSEDNGASKKSPMLLNFGHKKFQIFWFWTKLCPKFKTFEIFGNQCIVYPLTLPMPSPLLTDAMDERSLQQRSKQTFYTCLVDFTYLRGL